MTAKLAITLRLLKRWTTAKDSADRGGYWSLSQRVTELERAGTKFERKWVPIKGGRVLAYRLARDKKPVAATNPFLPRG